MIKECTWETSIHFLMINDSFVKGNQVIATCTCNESKFSKTQITDSKGNRK